MQNNTIYCLGTHTYEKQTYAWELIIKFRKRLTSQGEEERKDYVWGGVQRELQFHL